jgi:hypothetical protein
LIHYVLLECQSPLQLIAWISELRCINVFEVQAASGLPVREQASVEIENSSWKPELYGPLFDGGVPHRF